MKRSRTSQRSYGQFDAGEFLEFRLNLSAITAVGGEPDTNDGGGDDAANSEHEGRGFVLDNSGGVDVNEAQRSSPQTPTFPASNIPALPAATLGLADTNQLAAIQTERDSWDELEKALEDADKSGSQFTAQESHLSLLDIVIPHVAQDLLVKPNELQSMVVLTSSSRSVVDAKAASDLTSVSEETKFLNTAVDKTALLKDAAGPASTSSLVSVPGANLRDDEPAVANSVGGGFVLSADVNADSSVADPSVAAVALMAAKGSAASVGGTSASIPIESVAPGETPIVTETDTVAIAAVQGMNIAGLLPASPGIHFGAGLAVLNQGVQFGKTLLTDRVEPVIEGMQNIPTPDSRSISIASTVGKATLLAAAIITASRFDGQQQLQKIARHIRRTFAW